MTLEGIPAGEAIDLDVSSGAFSTAARRDKTRWSDPAQRGRRAGVSLRPGGKRHLRRAPDRHHPQHQHPLRRLRKLSGACPGRVTPTTRRRSSTAGPRTRRAAGIFPGRLTAPLCVAGGICLQLLRAGGHFEVRARVALHWRGCGRCGAPSASPGGEGRLSGRGRRARRRGCASGPSRQAPAEAGDSVGGVIEVRRRAACRPGLGDPMFGGMENRIASIVFGIPAVKGVEFGRWASSVVAPARQSRSTTPFAVEDGRVRHE